jgi:hypothetical protein
MPTMFDTYKIQYFSSYQGFLPDAQIFCYQGTTFVGQIEFHKAETSNDALGCGVLDAGKPYVRYRSDRFRDVYRLLLHEKPLFLWVDEMKGNGSVGTADYEPIGEEE